MDFGSFIREERKKKRLSARKLAEVSGISQAYLSQLETGANKKPSIEIINKIAKGLDVPNGTLMLMAGYIEDPFELIKMTPEEQEEFMKQQQKQDIRAWNITEYQQKRHVRIEDFLNDTKRKFYIDDHQLSTNDIKMLISLFGGKEKNYPSDEQIQKEYDDIKKEQEKGFFVMGADYDINTSEGE